MNAVSAAEDLTKQIKLVAALEAGGFRHTCQTKETSRLVAKIRGIGQAQKRPIIGG